MRLSRVLPLVVASLLLAIGGVAAVTSPTAPPGIGCAVSSDVEDARPAATPDDVMHDLASAITARLSAIGDVFEAERDAMIAAAAGAAKRTNATSSVVTYGVSDTFGNQIGEFTVTQTHDGAWVLDVFYLGLPSPLCTGLTQR